MSRAAFHTPAVHSGNFAQLCAAVAALNEFYDNEQEDARIDHPKPKRPPRCVGPCCGGVPGCPEYAEADESEVE